MLDKNTWNHLNPYKQISSHNLFKNKIIHKLFAYKLYVKTRFDIKYPTKVDVP